RGRDLAREPRPLDVQLTRAVAQRVLVELEPRAAERVGLDDVAARVEIALVDAGHDVGVGVVPQLGARAVEQAGREQHGAVAAVEDERVSGLDALHDLPAARLHAETATPSSIFAFTTASVESLAEPSAPISSQKAWLTGAPPTRTFTPSGRPALISASVVRFMPGM